MPNQRWDERLEDELARRGVPVRSRRRLLAELRDHADDLRDEEGLIMTDTVLDERLGRPAELAAQSAHEYRRSTWEARYPLWVFAVLPLPAAFAVCAVSVLLWVLGFKGVERLFADSSGEMPRQFVVASSYGLAWFVRIGIRSIPLLLPTPRKRASTSTASPSSSRYSSTSLPKPRHARARRPFKG